MWLKEQRARLSAKSRLSEKLAYIARHWDGLKHVDVTRRTVFQDAREVRTKRAETFTSDFFPVGPGDQRQCHRLDPSAAHRSLVR